MVGVRIMPNNGADARDGDNRKRNHEGKLVNGERGSRADATDMNPSSNVAIPNGAMTSKAGPTMLDQKQMNELPPELVHITSEHYHPLSRLLERISLECFNDLQGLLASMADLQGSQQSNGVVVNGQGSYPENPEVSKQKKLLLMHFAQTNRAKFIKLLVLTQWGKKSSVELTKLIDLFAWGKEQEMHMDMVDKQIEQFKIALSQARQYNPDIRTALQILSTGKAEWIPHLGYVPPKPLAAADALALMRHLNTTASIRLNVYDRVPQHLKSWHVANGRAIFTIDSEFEMELLTFTEEATDQWHFIDLKLLFSPAPVIDAGASRFWANFKPHVDRILRESGLSGCFDYLHNFVLTHKIAILKSQAQQISRAAWAGAIKIEPVHRMLVVQYWLDKPGRKSWIEIGISSRRPRTNKISWRGQPISALTVRWFRQGVQVKDVDLKIDFHQLSMERILKRIIALHITHLLLITREGLSPKMTVNTNLSEAEPCDCSLDISLGRSDNKTTIAMEPASGKFLLRPSALISSKAEQAINNQARDSAASPGVTVMQLLAQTLQDSIQRHAQQLGWRSQSRNFLKIETLKQATVSDALQYSLFWPRGWPAKWSLGVVVNASGETWWFLELSARGTEITYAEQLRLDQPDPKPAISRSTLSSIERVAVQQLSFSVTRRECEKRHLPTTITTEVVLPSIIRQPDSSQNYLRGWVLQLRTPDLLKTNPGEEPWLEPFIRVMCQGVKGDNRRVSHIASGTMVKAVAADMKKLMSSSSHDPFTFSENGTFAILLTTPFGEEMFTELGARLRDVDRLRSFSTILQKRRIRLKSSSLQHVTFQYSQANSATVNFSKHNDIKIEFGPGNPHNRVRTHLGEMINERSPFYTPDTSSTGLDRFCCALVMTRPILATLTELENETPGNLQNPKVHVHDLYTYRITYANPLCSFDIRLRTKDDGVIWQIEDNDKKAQDSKPSSERLPTRKRLDSLRNALNDLFKGKGEGWFGIRSGALAEKAGIQTALQALHQAVKSCAVEDNALPYIEVTPPTGHLNPGAQMPNGQGRPPPQTIRGGQGPVAQGNAMRQGNGKKQDVIEID